MKKEHHKLTQLTTYDEEVPQTHPADDHDDTSRHEWQHVLQVVVAVLVLEDGDDHGARQQQEGAEFLGDLGVKDENGVEGEDGAEEIAESQSAVIHDAQLVHVVGVARVVKLQTEFIIAVVVKAINITIFSTVLVQHATPKEGWYPSSEKA